MVGRRFRSAVIGLLWLVLKGSGLQTFGQFAILRVLRLGSDDLRLGEPIFPREVEIRAANIPQAQEVPEADYPAIGYRKIADARVCSNRRVSAVVQGKNLLLPESVSNGPLEIRVGEPTTGGILRQDSDQVLVRLRTSSHLDAGIFVGSWSPHNWFHWTVDILPSIFLARFLPREFDDFPILVPEKIKSRSAWMEPMELVLGRRELRFIGDRHYTFVKNLIWVDSPSCPGPLIRGARSTPAFSLHGSAMRSYRAHVLQGLELDPETTTQKRRVFLARAEGTYRGYNQEEALELASDYGFEPVYLEKLSFMESVKVMLEAEAVIGPHGAGWANAIYCKPGTIGIMWTWDESVHDNWFANIGKLAEMEFSVLLTGSVHHTAHNISKAQLREALGMRFDHR